MTSVALSYPLFALSRIIISSERCRGRGAVGLISSSVALAVNLSLGFLLIGKLGVSGAAYANNASIKKVANSTFMVAPADVDVMGELVSDDFDDGKYYI